jgi:hypothetical protein
VTITGCVDCKSGVDCDDGNPCTDDACQGKICVHTNNAAPCDDGNKCTTGDRCQGGQCRGTPVACPATDQCHNAGTCDPGSGACSNPSKPDGASCDDGSKCTTGDRCTGGQCGGTATVCAASDQCHNAGTCDPTSGACSNPSKPDGAGCNDGNKCTTGDQCRSGTCMSGQAVVCAATDQCHTAGTCNPGTGTCSNPSKPDGASCDDGSKCTAVDQCQGGQCTGGSPVVCSALDQCHRAGTCDPGTGTCSNPAQSDGTPCDDGNACTLRDACQAGACVGGGPASCDDGNKCTTDSCDPANGCNHVSISGCRPCSTAADCADGNPCTNDACQGGTCVYTNSTASCDDGNKCTTGDQCQGGQCRGTPVVCPAPDQCHTAGSCDPGTGACSNTKPDGSTCDDGNQCTVGDACRSGICAPGTPKSCDDGNACTIDSCDPAHGCNHMPNPDCSPCSTDTDCNDFNPCTDDTCADGRCLHTNNVAPCDDGDGCTVNDVCQGGRCTPGSPRSCDDALACTDDSCVAGACHHAPVDARCDSGDCALAACRPGDPGADTSGCVRTPVTEGQTCTDDGFSCTDDVCRAGRCQHVAVDRCPAAGECVPAVCNPLSDGHDAAGCVPLAQLANGTQCSEDGDACTDDRCQSGACDHVPVPDKVTCDPVQGAYLQARALATSADALAALVGSQQPQTSAVGLAARPSLATRVQGVASALDSAVQTLSGRSPVQTTSARARRPGPLAGFGLTVSQQRARAAFIEVRNTPAATRGFLKALGTPDVRARFGVAGVADLRRRGRDLFRGTRSLKNQLTRLQRVTTSLGR